MTQFNIFIFVLMSFAALAQPDPRIAILAQQTHATCARSDDAIITITILEGEAPAVIQWNNTTESLFGAAIIPTSGDLFHISGLKPGNYKVYISNTVGADTSFSLVLKAPPLLEYKITFEAEKCFRANTAFISIDTIFGGIPPYSARINNVPEPNFRWENLEAGTYFIEMEDAVGCIREDAVILPAGPEFSFDLGSPAVVFTGDTVFGTFTAERTLSTITWTPEDCCTFRVDGSYDIYADKSTMVNLCLTDTNGCKAVDDWFVTVKRRRDLYAPNVFTPDSGDEENRHFCLFANDGVADLAWMKIADREGRIWFEEKNVPVNAPMRGWNGTAGGQKAPSNVYFWAAQVRYTDGRSLLFTGDVTVVR